MSDARSASQGPALWVSAERQPLSASLLMAVGSLGAMASTAPMQFAVKLVGWRWEFAGIACCALAVAVLIGTLVPEHPGPLPAVNTRQLASRSHHRCLPPGGLPNDLADLPGAATARLATVAGHAPLAPGTRTTLTLNTPAPNRPTHTQGLV